MVSWVNVQLTTLHYSAAYRSSCGLSWPPRTRIIGCNHVVCTLTATRTSCGLSCGLSSTATRTSPPASPAASRASPLAWPSASSTTPASGLLCLRPVVRTEQGGGIVHTTELVEP